MLSGPVLSWLFVSRACGRAEVARVKASPDCFKYEGSAWERKTKKGQDRHTQTIRPSFAFVCFGLFLLSGRSISERAIGYMNAVCARFWFHETVDCFFCSSPLLCPPPYLKIPHTTPFPPHLTRGAHAAGMHRRRDTATCPSLLSPLRHDPQRMPALCLAHHCLHKARQGG